MEDHIDRLFQQWHRLGGAVLLSVVDHGVTTRPPEDVIAESTAHCRESGRLTWVVLDWMIRHVDEIDEERILHKTEQSGDLSVLGVLCDAARQRKPHLKFQQLILACTPQQELVPFFHRVARSPLALRLTQENALDIFRRWNYLCRELRYLNADPAEAGQGAGTAVQPASPLAKPALTKIDLASAQYGPDQPTHSEDGVDLTLIRWMLSMTPAERLETLQQHVWSILRLRGDESET